MTTRTAKTPFNGFSVPCVPCGTIDNVSVSTADFLQISMRVPCVSENT
jgi:hypothetical protein